jgi:hypothetical protein
VRGGAPFGESPTWECLRRLWVRGWPRNRGIESHNRTLTDPLGVAFGEVVPVLIPQGCTRRPAGDILRASPSRGLTPPIARRPVLSIRGPYVCCVAWGLVGGAGAAQAAAVAAATWLAAYVSAMAWSTVDSALG